MAGIDDDPQHVVETLVPLDDDHLRTRHHDFPHLRLGDFEHAGEHVLLLGSKTLSACCNRSWISSRLQGSPLMARNTRVRMPVCPVPLVLGGLSFISSVESLVDPRPGRGVARGLRRGRGL
ncbi:MAG: hypothetical protein U5K76_11925 [Woeseiaceae bacterium]|nr:hypothetical protein [Woeseiaceae bacterium]